MEVINIKAEERTKQTKGQRKTMRKQGFVPGVLYHGGKEAKSLSVKSIDLRDLIYTNESHVINLTLGDSQPKQAILKKADFDPTTDQVTHVDFLEIQEGQKIEIEVPISVVGTAEGVKLQGGKLFVSIHKVTIKCKPIDILGHIDVDVTHLKLGESVHLDNIQAMLDKEKHKVIGDLSVVVLAIMAPTKLEEVATVESEEEVTDEKVEEK